MAKKPDDRITSWTIDAPQGQSPQIHGAAFLDEDSDGHKSEMFVNRSGFIAMIAAMLGFMGLKGCAYFFQSKRKGNWSRKNRFQYCKCVPVCVCDMVCTCNLVSGKTQREKEEKDEMTSEEDSRYTCSCVPVCTCDLVCTCNAQCTCQSQGGRSRKICTCNPYWYPN